jgi:hypothetical protein
MSALGGKADIATLQFWPVPLSSQRVFGERVSWVTCITTTVLPAYISNQRFWVLCLGLEGGDERIFPVDDEVLAFSLQL